MHGLFKRKLWIKYFERYYSNYLLEVPDGGDGGDGGDVYFRSTGRLSSLYDLRRAHFYGNNGKYGLVSIFY